MNFKLFRVPEIFEEKLNVQPCVEKLMLRMPNRYMKHQNSVSVDLMVNFLPYDPALCGNIIWECAIAG